jgi:gamma-glutamylcyclotransferase
MFSGGWSPQKEYQARCGVEGVSRGQRWRAWQVSSAVAYCDGMSQLYFAFGSNMSRSTLRNRGVDANPGGAALLRNHRLAFTLPSERWTGRAADILPASGAGVWGVLWEMAEPDALDPFELRYIRSEVDVVQFSTGRAGHTQRAFAYTVKPEHRATDEAPPAPEYLRRMIKGAIDAGLPAYYIDFLRSCSSFEHFGSPPVVLGTSDRSAVAGLPLDPPFPTQRPRL